MMRSEPVVSHKCPTPKNTINKKPLMFWGSERHSTDTDRKNQCRCEKRCDTGLSSYWDTRDTYFLYSFMEIGGKVCIPPIPYRELQNVVPSALVSQTPRP